VVAVRERTEIFWISTVRADSRQMGQQLGARIAALDAAVRHTGSGSNTSVDELAHGPTSDGCVDGQSFCARYVVRARVGGIALNGMVGGRNPREKLRALADS
jgi:hypothetical protein